MVFCRHCGNDFSYGEVSYCPTCGKPQRKVTEVTSPKPTKKHENTLAIAILAGAVAFNGFGHLYMGKIRRGIKLLMVGWVLGALTILIPILGVVYFVFWIWQAYDAYKTAKRNSESGAKYGKGFW